MGFRLPLSSLLDRSGNEALSAICHAPRKKIQDLLLLDLIFDDGAPTTIWHGVYAFFHPDGHCVYVGKNGSQNFIERIPWHFALAEGAYMNHLLKRTRDHRGLKSLADAARLAGDYQLLLIPVDPSEHYDDISRLEDFLRLFLMPDFNPASKTKQRKFGDLDLTKPLRSLLNELL